MNKLKLKGISDLLSKDIYPARISSRITSLFLKQLSLLLNSGLNLNESLVIIKNQNLDKRLSKVLSSVLINLDKGYSTFDAFNNTSNAFSPMLLAFIKSGEESGKLGEILDDLAEYISTDTKNKAKIKQAFIYPIILLIVTVIVVILIVTLVMPTFIETFNSSDMKLPLNTIILIGLTNFLEKNALILLFLILLITSLFLYLRTKEKSRYKIDKFIFKNLPFKDLRLLNYEYQISSLLYILRSGDINIIECINIIESSISNHYLKERLLYVKNSLMMGLSLNDALAKEGIFTNLLVSMIKVGEDSGNLVKALEKSSEYYSSEYIFRLQRFSKLIEPLLILIMAAVVGFVVFSVTIPMFDSVNAIY